MTDISGYKPHPRELRCYVLYDASLAWQLPKRGGGDQFKVLTRCRAAGRRNERQ